MKKLLVFLLIIGVLVMVFSTVLAKNYKIAVVFKALNSDWWKTVQAGVNAGAKDFNVEVSVVGPQAETAVMEQFNMIQDQINRNINALVVAPLRPTTTNQAFEQAKKAGIPVFVFDTKANWPDQVTFIGLDNYDIAKGLGKYIREKVLTTGGNLVIIRGAMGDKTHDDRVNGVLDEVKGANIEVLTIQPGNSERGIAMNVMQNILLVHQNVDLVFCTNDEMALGALRAVETMRTRTKIKVIGWDGTSNALASIRDGKLYATVDGNAFCMGYDVVKYVVKYLNGEKIDKNIEVDYSIIDHTNFEKFIERLQKVLKRKI